MNAGRGVTLSRLGLGAVGLVTSAALGVAATVLCLTPATPKSLAAARPATSAPVSQQEFDDRRSVDLTATRAPTVAITLPRGGRITRSSCGTSALESGSVAVAVDGVVLVALATSVPLWRDLVPGDKGEDVVAVQTELARLGHPVTADGSVGSSTVSAFGALMKAAGDAAYRSESIPASRIVWLPAPTVRPGSCTHGVGGTVEAGSVLATVAGALTAVAVVRQPDALVPGDRVLEIDGRPVPAGADGTVTDPDVLAAIADTPSFRTVQRTAEAQENAEASTIGAKLRLKDPVTVLAVPPSAVYGIVDGEGCVRSAGRSIPVTIVGSQLGETFLRAEGSAPLRTVELAPSTQPPCR